MLCELRCLRETQTQILSVIFALRVSVQKLLWKFICILTPLNNKLMYKNLHISDNEYLRYVKRYF